MLWESFKDYKRNGWARWRKDRPQGRRVLESVERVEALSTAVDN